MCKGAEEKKRGGGFCRGFPSEEVVVVSSFGATRGSITSCELCGLRASLYCHADDAYLCRKCDKWVHKANFLAFRHVRCFLCNTCQNLTRRYLIGASREVLLPATVGTIENLPNNNSTHRNCSLTKQNGLFLFL